ncbi:2-hydroxychromene-2-carboxylate isomerase [Ancylobacter dichloromethanicus]|uniref:2-hydroxychromene-2-carboxylate isomerase n=1 Tax=Ancylobacter dichloromethanicus TaxID=518825 RepID=A0A9W6J7P2_9HYPH|nr:2-hydroxychromene-2-carboxylate isomerase [Ancylobacter dichloromethanicus]MBS7555063.1 2-hydroxychromene-2-carboxylate isomerase [Ancylobacter dichloromethanicus]GLK72272.1 2-hydroxychromene-2-carboxylate isomerase [Ancylobacter dichloromethanicus]
MSRLIDYYFSVVSPWAFIGHAPFLDLARRHGARVNCRPVLLGELFSETGGLPLSRRHPARQRYRMLELKRWREARGIEFNVNPAHWPFDPRPGDRLLIAAQIGGHDVAPLAGRLMSGVWQREENLADPATLAAVLVELGLPATLLEAAADDRTAIIYQANHDDAVAADVFGSPAYVLDGEVFWGQDRIELLDRALSSGRAPFTP